MEPLAHEGLARLLQLDASLQTPCIAFSDSFESSEDLTSGGSIKIGRSIALPPRPLGLDSSKAPYLQLSDEIAVLDNASSLDPKKLIDIASRFRFEAGYSRLIYAPAVEPSDMPILAYLGIDVFDDLNVELRSATGWALDGGSWVKSEMKVKDLQSQNRDELERWILKIRSGIMNGTLRELVETTSLHNPRVSKILHHSTSLLIEKGARRSVAIRANNLSLSHPSVVDFQQRLSDFVPPSKDMVLLVLPCSARKPYFKSSSHKRFYNTIREVDNHLNLHIVSVTSPLGLVPRELEFCYPAAHYDIAVTGEWSASEVQMLRDQFSRLEPEKHYSKAVVHAGSSSEIITELLNERGLSTVNTESNKPSSADGLDNLQEAARTALKGLPHLNPKDRAKGEALGLAKFQYGKLSSFLTNSEIGGRMPYKLKCANLASISPTVGGFGLTLAGAEAYIENDGPSVVAEDFKLVGDLFAVGVKSCDGEWVIGDQVAIKQKGKITGVGIAKMNPEEMLSMKRGLAVEVRHHA